MNLTWHIIKKDLRALKWPLALWVLTIVAKLGVGVLLLGADGNEGAEWFQRMDALGKILAAGECLSFVLVAALIQEDLMVGTTAFWMTRPIAGGRLLRAKLLSIGFVFLVVPVLVTLPWWLGCHYGPDEIAWAATETVVVHAIVVLAALVWSAVTDGLGRFLLWTLVTLVTMPMLTAILSFYFRKNGVAAAPEVASTRLLVLILVLAVGTLAVLLNQYLTRYTWRSFAIIGATATLGVLTLGFWPWSWNVETRVYGYLIRRAQGEWSAANEPPGLNFKLVSAQFAARKDRANRPGTLTTFYRVQGLSPSQGFIGYPSEHTWRWADGSVEQGYSLANAKLNTLALAQATVFVKGTPVVTDPQEDLVMRSILPGTTMARVRGEPAAYALQARLRLMQHESTAIVPAQPGTLSASERISAVEKSGEQLLVTFIRHNPEPFVDVVGGGRLAPYEDFARYLLVNRQTGYVDGGAAIEIRQTRIATVSIRWQTLAFRGTAKGGGAKPSLEAINALNDAELLKVNYREQARFIHEVKLDPTQVAQANP